MINLVYFMVDVVRGWMQRKPETSQYYVCSMEPFSQSPIWRGPLTQKEAGALMSINSACGSDDFLYKDLDGILVAI